jgi:hypothetical protein
VTRSARTLTALAAVALGTALVVPSQAAAPAVVPTRATS